MSRVHPVYVVDDQELIRHLLIDLCELQGWAARGFANGIEFLDAAPALAAGCVLLDMRMPGLPGLSVQQELLERGLPFQVIAITGHGDVDMAVESMKLGAVDFIEKPFDNDVLLDAIRRGFALLDGHGPA